MLSLQQILDFPVLGPSQTQWADLSAGNIADQYLLRLGAGVSGVVRNVEFYWLISMGRLGRILWSGGSGYTDLKNWRIRVYVDCGDVADLSNPPAGALAVDLPWATLLGGEYGAEPAGERCIETDLFSILYFSDGAPDGVRAVCMSLRVPIPFENGVLIQIGWMNGNTWVPLAGTSDREFVYHECGYELGVLPATYADVRIKSRRTVATNAAPGDLTILDETSNAGWMIALWLAMSQANLQEGCFESDPSFTTDRTLGTVWQVGGVESLGGIQQAYYFSLGPVLDRLSGTLQTQENHGAEIYSLFMRRPLRWTDGCSGVYPMLGDAEGKYNGSITLLYYVAESVVLTPAAPGTAPEGELSLALSALSTALADCESFRTLTGAATRAQAQGRIHLGGLPDPANGTELTLSEWQTLRPYALIWMPGVDETPDGFHFSMDAVDDGFAFSPAGVVLLQVAWAVDPAIAGDRQEVYLQAMNLLGQIMAELSELAGKPDYLAFTRLSFLGPFRTDPKARQKQGDASDFILVCDVGEQT
jgi:hypothetical protein